MTKNRRSRVGVVEEQVQQPAARSESTSPKDPNPLYGVAMLKVALEMKRHPELSVEQALSQVVTAMNLDEDAFRQHLARNDGLLRTLRPPRR